MGVPDIPIGPDMILWVSIRFPVPVSVSIRFPLPDTVTESGWGCGGPPGWTWGLLCKDCWCNKGLAELKLCKICRPGFESLVSGVTVVPRVRLGLGLGLGWGLGLLKRATCWAGTMRRGWPCWVTISFWGPPWANWMGWPEAVRTVALRTLVGRPGNPEKIKNNQYYDFQKIAFEIFGWVLVTIFWVWRSLT